MKNKKNIKLVDNLPKIWCETCTKEEKDCKGKCKNYKKI